MERALFAWKVAAFAAFAAAGKLREGARENRMRVEGESGERGGDEDGRVRVGRIENELKTS